MPRRLLLLITDLEMGGTPTVVRELAVRLHEAGRFEVEVACLGRWGPVADQIRAAGVPVTALGARSVASFPVTLARLVRLIRRGRVDTVFSFLVHANALAAVASGFVASGVRFLQSVQTTQPDPRWHWWVQRLIHPAAEAVVVPSPSAARAAHDWSGVPRGRLVVIPNAVDVPSFDDIYRRDRKPDGPTFRVAFIGRLDPIKRVPDLLQATAGMPGIHVDLYGEGADRPRIEAEVDRLGMRGRVTLHGAVPSPHAALAAADVLVLPSAAEGFGLVLIEAMAAGVPVVATDVPGIRDVVADGRTGLLFPSGDPPGLRAGIMALMATDGRRVRLIPAARAEVERRYAWPAVLAQYHRLLM